MHMGRVRVIALQDEQHSSDKILEKVESEQQGQEPMAQEGITLIADYVHSALLKTLERIR